MKPNNPDPYRRRKVDPDTYQCGCHWSNAKNIPEAHQAGVTGDVLVECPLHAQATKAKHDKRTGSP